MTSYEPRYLCDAHVAELLPDASTAVVLARTALVARAEGRAQVPPKPTVQLAGGAFANAMPAALLDEGVAGCKWVSMAPDNPARGLPAAQGVAILVDATTGELRCVIAARELTAIRTAAVTGACLEAFIPTDWTVAFLGTGEQARSHLRILDGLGHTRVCVQGRRHEALDVLSLWCAEHLQHLRPVFTTSRQEAVEGADAVITGYSIGLQGMELDATWLRPDVLLLPLDYASQVGAKLARGATLASDDVEQFVAMVPLKLAADYPLTSTFTGSLLAGPRPPGRVVIQNLGNGSSDLVFAAHLAEQAELRGVGTILPR